MDFSPLTSSTIPHHGKYSSRSGVAIARLLLHHWAGTRGGDTRLADPSADVSATYLIKDGKLIGQVPEHLRPWTTGGFQYDAQSITVEVQNSDGSPQWPVSPENYSMIVRLLIDLNQRYGWGGIGAAQLRGHREFVATACPGPYLWDRMGDLRNRANAGNPGGGGNPAPTPSPAPSGSITDIARAVVRGDYGVGDERRRRLGSQYDAVQAEVNRLLGIVNVPAPSKSISQLADEVLAGKHGNGADRQRSLGNAFNAVQEEVNRRLGLQKPDREDGPTDIDRMAREVLAGKYGNGEARRAALGANFNAVQARVNQILDGAPGTAAPAASLDSIAKAVYRGDYGNGEDRSRKLRAAGYDPNAVQRRVNQLYYS